jgi:hypothetical protein
VGQGSAAFKEGQMENAIAAYTRAIAALPRPNHPDASTFLSNRAACHKNLGAHGAVIADCTASLQLNPSNWKVRYFCRLNLQPQTVDDVRSQTQVRRGYAYEATEKYALAHADMHACAANDPEARRVAARLAKVGWLISHFEHLRSVLASVRCAWKAERAV